MPYAFNNPAFRLGGVMGGGTIIPTSTFVSAEIGAVDSATVVVTYSGAAPSVSSGHVVKVNSASVTIASHSISGSTVRLTLADAADALDTLLVSCSSGSGNIIAHTDSAVTNNAVSMASFGSLKVAFTARRPEYLGETAEVSPIDPVEDGDRIYTAVSPWGSGNNLVQATTANQPIYEADGWVIFDKDTSPDRMVATLDASDNGDFTIAIVFNTTDAYTATTKELCGTWQVNLSVYAGHIFSLGQDTANRLGFYTDAMSWQYVTTPTFNDGSTFVVVYHGAVSGANQTITMYLAKIGTDSALANVKSATAVNDPTPLTNFTVGSRVGGTNGFDGNMKEFIYYPGGVSDITAFLDHMALRWL